MANISDVYNKLQDAVAKLDTLDSDLQVIANRLTALDTDLNSGFYSEQILHLIPLRHTTSQRVRSRGIMYFRLSVWEME